MVWFIWEFMSLSKLSEGMLLHCSHTHRINNLTWFFAIFYIYHYNKYCKLSIKQHYIRPTVFMDNRKLTVTLQYSTAASFHVTSLKVVAWLTIQNSHISCTVPVYTVLLKSILKLSFWMDLQICILHTLTVAYFYSVQFWEFVANKCWWIHGCVVKDFWICI